MAKLYMALDDRLVGMAERMQGGACATLSLTPPQFRTMTSIAALALSSICGLIGSCQLHGTADFNIWIIPYALWLFMTLSALYTVVSFARSSPDWSAAEHRKLLLGAVMTRANQANNRLVMTFLTALIFVIVVAGTLIGGGHGTFFFSMVALYFLNYTMRGYLAATEVPPLQGRFRNDTGF
jgi:hypothetical protein